MRDRLAVWYREQGKAVRHQMAPAMQCMLEAADDREWSDAMFGGLFLSELWALEANAPISESGRRGRITITVTDLT